MKISPSTHTESALTGSPLSSMVRRAAALKREYFSYTDLGHLSSALKTYGLAKKEGLKPVLGIEFYFKDALCPFVGGTKADRCKYFTGTIYGMDQEAYQAICKVVSKTDLTKVEILEEEMSLWGWNEIENLSKFQTQFLIGGPHCMVGKAYLADGPEVAEKVFLRLKSWFKERLSVSIICEPWAKKYATVIKIEYTDGTYDSLLASDLVTTDKARKIKASDLIERSGHNEIQSKIVNQTYFNVYKKIYKVTEHKGFLPLPVDVTLEINKFLLSLAKKHKIRVLASDYAFYSEKEDKIVQKMVLEGKNILKSDLHMKSEDECKAYMTSVLGMSHLETEAILNNNDEWAKNFDGFELKYEWRLADSGGNALQQCMDIIKKNGRMKWDNPVWVARLREEIQVIAKNGKKDFSAYFLPIYDVVTYYRENGKLTGPSRGSAGGSLFCYLMGITNIDPIKYNLSFPRFLSLNRLKNGDIPDVDTDFPDRELLVGRDGKSGYLYQRWGNKAAQISTRHMVRLKSAIKDTNRYINGSVEKEIEALTKSLPDAPQGVPDKDFVFGYEDSDGNHIPGLIEISNALRTYAETRPKEWGIVQKSLGVVRAQSQHASAFCISDIPLSDLLPIKDGHITQYEAKQVEACGILKYDFLTVSNILDIEVCLKLINKKNNEKQTIGYFTHKGKVEYVWDLPHDIEAYKSCWGKNTATLFQINTPAMANTTSEIMPQSIDDGSIILALERPGPKDFVDPNTGKNMVEEYIDRRNGVSKPDLPELFELIPETYGVIVFQEQSLKISKELGGMTPSDAEKLRRIFSKKQKKEALDMKPVFMSTAIPKIGEEKANKIWDMMETSSRYSFNASHSYGYFLITYAGIFLRHNYPLEWWTAILSNAKQSEIAGRLWPHVKHLVASPDINLSSDQMEIDYANHKIRAKLGIIRGLGDKTISPIVKGRPYKDIQDFVDRDVAGPALTRKLIHVGVLDSLFPPKYELLQKMQQFEDALEIKKFNKKYEETPEKLHDLKLKLEIALKENDGTLKSEARVARLKSQTSPAKGEIPEEYFTIEKDPMKNAAIKKNILPSLLVGLYHLGRNYSKCIPPEKIRPSRMMNMINDDGDLQEVILVTGEMLQKLNEDSGEGIRQDVYVAVTAFIVDTEVRDYKKNTKQMLKVFLDCDGYVQEHVLWPNYFTNELNYPKELKKGNICTVFLKKRAGKPDICSIVNIVIEA